MRNALKSLGVLGLALLVALGAVGVCQAGHNVAAIQSAIGACPVGVGCNSVVGVNTFGVPLTTTRFVRSAGGVRTVFVPNAFGTNVVVGSPFVNTFGIGGFNTFGGGFVNRSVVVNRNVGVNRGRNVAVNVNRGRNVGVNRGRNVAVNVNRGARVNVQKSVNVNRAAPRVQSTRTVTRVR